ncbi:neutral zinc metallopeptidase [Micrococcus lylae]|uniref:KPN_02809 family neutral zinc metallopeptidase n=1 Tax=Micrococcus lylae TaxID=1273 RepID=UPI0021A3B857|nr:neutral zinc metallopeptidase [Micrococcus lylae]MCT2007266.1 neutral zinc metallopeptidase [Micrococcus lylae]MCT2070938.1 neutral zinc metallopeptidase [Micrococcus lylae]
MSFNDNVQLDPGRARDSRGRSGGRGAVLGGGRVGGRGIALGGGAGLLAVLIYFIAPGFAEQVGINPDGTIGGGSYQQREIGESQNSGPGQQIDSCRTGADANERSDCRVLATTIAADTFWEEHLSQYRDVTFREPGVELFSGGVNTACGSASSAMGPFYCPGDESMYFDTDFFSTLQTDFGAEGGPLAEQYIVAHEYAHHIQQVIGWLRYSQDGRTGPDSGIVRVELQADCMAGMWAGSAAHTVDPESGETFLKPISDEQLRQALDAAASVGDDRIQQASTGQVRPEAFTHGTSEQRQRWFMRGYESGRSNPDINQCDTLSIPADQL